MCLSRNNELPKDFFVYFRRTTSVGKVSLADLIFIQSSFEQIHDIIEFVFNSIKKFRDKNDIVITKRYLVEISNLAEAFMNSNSVDGEACSSAFKSVHLSISHISHKFSENEGNMIDNKRYILQRL